VKGPLSGKVALVTGGAVRIGREVVRTLAAAGASVAVHAREHAKEAEEAAHEVRRLGGRSAVLLADLADVSACEGVVPACTKALGRIDLLVNCAGVFERTDPLHPDPAVWERMMAVNARAPWILTAAAGRAMARRGGAIVNFACESVLTPWTGWLAYGASKAALAHLTRGYAKALAPKVRVNAILPGPILKARGSTPERNRAAVAATAMKRWGKPSDVAAAVKYFAVDAPYVTGVLLPVDGGRHLA
jgi:pteridine reductase